MNNHNDQPSQEVINQTPLTLQEAITIKWQWMLEGSQNGKDRVGQIAKGFIELVEVHYQKEHSPLFYADQLKISKSYLRKACEQLIGFSPRHCIQTRLMLEACAMIGDPAHNTKEIAFSLGFEYPAHFSKFFKAYCGQSPESYRNLKLKQP